MTRKNQESQESEEAVPGTYGYVNRWQELVERQQHEASGDLLKKIKVVVQQQPSARNIPRKRNGHKIRKRTVWNNTLRRKQS